MIDEWSMPQVVKLDFEPTHRAASETRRQLRSLLQANGVEDTVLADVELATSELLSNAVEQAPEKPVELLVSIDELSVHLTVTNWHEPGSSIDIPDHTVKPKSGGQDPISECGRGLEIVHALADGMWVHGDRTSTSISFLHKRR